MNTDALFQPLKVKSLVMQNRFVMAPMTRQFSPGGIPTPAVADYYRRRAEGRVGLIISEGTVINRVASASSPNIPHFYGEAALAGWKKVIDGVHAAGGKMAPQIWHMGVQAAIKDGEWKPATRFEGPSDLYARDQSNGQPMNEADILATIDAYAQSALSAKQLGFDTVELHGAHGYLIDQFLWEVTNTRKDQYGGKTLAERTRFAVDVIKAVRQAVGPDFPILLRLSQWKPSDYDFKMAKNPEEMAGWLQPLADAGVDIFHCSQRRFWEPEFKDSDLNFAGWAKKLTGRATITVGSVGLSGDFTAAFKGEGSNAEPLDALIRRFEKGEFDLVAIGRALLSDPAWVSKARAGNLGQFKGFEKDDLGKLI